MTEQEIIQAYKKAKKRYHDAPINSAEEREAYKEMTELASKVKAEKLPKSESERRNIWI